MHYQHFLAISSLLLTGVLSVPVPDPVNKANGLKSAADDAYEFKISFNDESKLASNPAWAQILKDPSFKSSILKNNNPVLTNPIKGLHPKRAVRNAADDAYEFKVVFSDKSRLATNPVWSQILRDPAFKGSVFKNVPVLTNSFTGVHTKREETDAAEEA